MYQKKFKNHEIHTWVLSYGLLISRGNGGLVVVVVVFLRFSELGLYEFVQDWWFQWSHIKTPLRSRNDHLLVQKHTTRSKNEWSDTHTLKEKRRKGFDVNHLVEQEVNSSFVLDCFFQRSF